MTNISGFDDLADQLDEMADRAEELEGENEVSFADLFSEEFMRQHTDVSSFEEFIDNSEWAVESEEDFEAIPEDEFDEYVDKHTNFDSWESMYGTAGTEWMAREIGFR